MSKTKINFNQIRGNIANILDWGADPTGASDSSAAIQSCVNDSYGKWVYAPVGMYKLLSSIEINDQNSVTAQRPGTKIFGDGIANTIFQNESGAYAFKSSVTAGQYTPGYFSLGLRLQDFQIDCNHGVKGSGISLESAYYPIIDNVQVSGALEHGICTKVNAVLSGLGVNPDKYACGIIHIRNGNIGASVNYNVYSDQVANCFIIDSGYYTNGGHGGIYLTSNGNYVGFATIAGNGNGGVGVGEAGLRFAYGGATPHINVVEECEFDNNWNTQIQVVGYNSIIRRNRFVQDSTSGTGGVAYTCSPIIFLDGTHGGFPQNNVVEYNHFRFDNPNAGRAITAIQVYDGGSWTTYGNKLEGNNFSTTVGVTKYDFAARARSVGSENRLIVANSSPTPTRENMVVLVINGSNTNVQNAYTLIPHTTIFDSTGYIDAANNSYDNTNHRLIVPYNGILSISGGIRLRADTTAAVPFTVEVRVNNTPVAHFPAPSGFPILGGAVSADETVFLIDCNLAVAKNDYVEIFAICNTSNKVVLVGEGAGASTIKFEML